MSKGTSLWLAASLMLGGAGATAYSAQPAQTEHTGSEKALPSPPADAQITLNGTAVSVHYNAPSMRGRKIMGGLVPYGKVWRTGANPATLFKTAGPLTIGGTSVPAGTYTLYTLPSESTWMLIVNKQTGQWGTEYNQGQDFARIPMQKKTLSSPQETMSISFENTHGANSEMHIRWETTDAFVPVESGR